MPKIKVGDKVSYTFEGGFNHASPRQNKCVVKKQKSGKLYPQEGIFTDERDAEYIISNINKI